MLLLKNKKLFFAAMIFLLYLLPTFIQYSFSDDFRIKGVYLGLPHVLSGDEPHYLTVVYSIVEDFDLDLENNYTDAFWNGQCDAGSIYANTAGNESIGRHCQYHNIGKGELCITGHPIGLPLILSIFLLPFANSCLLENAAIYLMLAAALLSLLILYKILRHYGASEGEALFITALFAVATPIWYYSKSFWAETLIMFLLTFSYYLFFIKKRVLVSSLLMGLSFASKYTAAIPAAVMWLDLLKKRDFKKLVLFSIPFALFLFAVVYFNLFILKMHVPLRQLDIVGTGNILFGLAALLLSPKFGLFIFSPIVIFSILGMKEFYRNHKDECIWLAASLLFTWGLFASVSYLSSGIASFGPRYFVPFMPLLALPFFFWFKSNRNELLWKLFWAITIYSFILNLAAVIFYPAFWDREVWWFFFKAVEFRTHL